MITSATFLAEGKLSQAVLDGIFLCYSSGKFHWKPHSQPEAKMLLQTEYIMDETKGKLDE